MAFPYILSTWHRSFGCLLQHAACFRRKDQSTNKTHSLCYQVFNLAVHVRQREGFALTNLIVVLSAVIGGMKKCNVDCIDSKRHMLAWPLLSS